MANFGLSTTFSFDEIDSFPQQPYNNTCILAMPKVLYKYKNTYNGNKNLKQSETGSLVMSYYLAKFQVSAA